jgi:penicillin-binding protein 1A
MTPPPGALPPTGPGGPIPTHTRAPTDPLISRSASRQRMSDNDDNPPQLTDPGAPIPFQAPPSRYPLDDRGRPIKPRLRKLRILLILMFLGVLALVSTLFGMLTAVASDLPQIENRQQFGTEHNSYLYDDMWRPIGLLAPPNNNVIDTYGQIGAYARNAVVSTEDKRFWTNSGVDLRGVARAFESDVTGGATQGASTITEQFVKNALAEEDNRTILEKVREAAIAFQLTHRWKKTKILREYLNSVYFGNGAYGIESAARVYFGKQLGYDAGSGGIGGHGCGDSTPTDPRPSCASQLRPYQAALLAGMIANPSAFNPVYYPSAAKARRQVVLGNMLAQHYITRAQYNYGNKQPLPTAADIEQPQEPAAAPYFTSWLTPQILKAVGTFRAYYGGLRIRTTIDLPMQQAAEQAITEDLPTGANEPTASLVSIDNATGQVRAMVGGPLSDGQQNYEQYPFNLATESQRQPGSAFKLFTLAVALQHGYTPESVFDSKPLNLIVPNSDGKEHYHVRNFDDEYAGPTTLASATAQSDNSVFTQLGLSPGVGTKRISEMAKAMGIITPVSTNPAMIIGGLKVGVSPLEMADAYETAADGGNRIYDPVLGSPNRGPIGIAQIQCPQAKCHGKTDLVATPHSERVLPASVASTIHDLLRGVVTSGTGQAAAIGGVDVVGKTGTTTNEGDAWFVGWTPQFTTAIWVGFPNRLVPMLTQYNGSPVTGGTFPAEIWRTYMESALQINAEEHPAKKGASSTGTETSGDTSTYNASPGTGTTPETETAPPQTGTAEQTTPAPTGTTPQQTTPQQTTPQQTTPTPTPTNPTGTTPANGQTGTSGGTGIDG